MKTLSKLIKIAGGAFIFFAILGWIVGLFGYSLRFSGTKLPMIDWGMALALIIIGVIFYGAGHFLVKKFGDIDTEPIEQPKLDMNDLSFVHNAIRKTRNRNLIMGSFLAVFGLAMILLPLLSGDGIGVAIFLGLLGGLMLVIGVKALMQFSKVRVIETSEAFKLIMHTPQNITSLNALIVRNFGKVGQAINATIMVEKDKKAILAISEGDLELLHQYLLKHNPNLEFDKKIQQMH